jgi:hypothetical protein
MSSDLLKLMSLMPNITILTVITQISCMFPKLVPNVCVMCVCMYVCHMCVCIYISYNVIRSPASVMMPGGRVQ